MGKGSMDKNEFEFWQMEAGPGKMEADIFKAMEVYTRKTGQKADLVVVNPADLAANPIAAVGFEVQAMTNVQPGTIWVGKSQSDTGGQNTSGQNTSGQDRISKDF